MDAEAYAAVKANDARELKRRLREAESSFPVNVGARNGAGLTMLHVACYQGGYDCARVLLEKGRADVHATGKDCRSTPLQFAALSGNMDLVKLMLKYQGKVNYQNAAGKTAVHFAAVGGHLDVIRLLLSSGASCQLADNQGRSARDYAHEKGQRDAASLLAQAAEKEGYEQGNNDDTAQVRLTFENLDPAAIERKAELDRRYEARRRAEKEQRLLKEKEQRELKDNPRPPCSADPGGGDDGRAWAPIGDDDGFFQGKIPRGGAPKVDKGVGRKKEEFAGAVRGGGGGGGGKGVRVPGEEDARVSPRKGDGSPADNLEFLEKELQTIVGMEQVKSMLRSLCKKVSVDQQRSKYGFTNDQNLNMLFLGAPGTGKTSMARVVAKLLRHLGVLEKGHLVEVCRKDLVAEYSGQSAVKTAAKVQEALGGVLFVDEAYSLKHEGSKGNN